MREGIGWKREKEKELVRGFSRERRFCRVVLGTEGEVGMQEVGRDCSSLSSRKSKKREVLTSSWYLAF